MPALARAWQILLKGLGEVQAAPDPQAAAEMVIIRLAYSADLPDPADLVRRLKDTQNSTATGALSPQNTPPQRESTPPPQMRIAASGGGSARPLAQTEVETSSVQARAIENLNDVITCLEEGGAFILASEVYQYVHLVRLEEGLMEIRPSEDAPAHLASELGKKLSQFSGRRWMVSVSSAPGQPTLAQQAQAATDAELEAARNHPDVKAILEAFPGARLTGITNEA